MNRIGFGVVLVFHIAPSRPATCYSCWSALSILGSRFKSRRQAESQLSWSESSEPHRNAFQIHKAQLDKRSLACLPRPEASRNRRPELPGMLLLDSDEAKVHNLQEFAILNSHELKESSCICLVYSIFIRMTFQETQLYAKSWEHIVLFRWMFTSWSRTHWPTPWRPSEPTLEP